MRTETVRVPALLLAAALLGAGGLPLAAQDGARQEVRREIVEAQRADIEARRGAVEAHAEARREMARAAHELQQAGVSVLTGDQVVAKGETVDGDMVVVGGDLRVEGEIRGDAIVTEGDLLLEEGGRVLGNAVVTGGQLLNHGGRILGEMRTLATTEHAEVVHVAPKAAGAPRQSAHFDRSWFQGIAEGIAGVFSTLAFGLVLAGMGAALIFYGLPYLRTVSDTVRRHTGRSAAVGLAASFLIIPAFVVMVVALAISIIGIPVLLVAIPLYPLAVVAAFGFGVLAVAHVIGEYTAERRGTFDFHYRNAYAYVFLGIALLLAPHLAGHMIGMVGFLGWVGMLLQVVGAMILWAAATLGLGAVILTRAGTRQPFPERSFDPVLDGDPLFDAEPVAREPHV